MEKYIFVCLTIVSIFCVSCSSINVDDEKRISGIVSACKAYPQKMDTYLQQKVKNDQISKIVSFTIKECLKNE